jgi:hypothetical protein
LGFVVAVKHAGNRQIPLLSVLFHAAPFAIGRARQRGFPEAYLIPGRQRKRQMNAIFKKGSLIGGALSLC